MCVPFNSTCNHHQSFIYLFMFLILFFCHPEIFFLCHFTRLGEEFKKKPSSVALSAAEKTRARSLSPSLSHFHTVTCDSATSIYFLCILSHISSLFSPAAAHQICRLQLHCSLIKVATVKILPLIVLKKSNSILT